MAEIGVVIAAFNGWKSLQKLLELLWHANQGYIVQLLIINKHLNTGHRKGTKCSRSFVLVKIKHNPLSKIAQNRVEGRVGRTDLEHIRLP